MANQTPRFIAVDLLDRIEKDQAFSNLILDQAIEANRLSTVDANLLTELVYGVMQHKYTLDYYLQPFTSQQKKLENWVKQILRISAYQFTYLDRIPDYAIINEAVEIAKKRGHRGIANMVNGILRNYKRSPLKSIEDLKKPVEYLSIKESFPEWLVESFIHQYGLNDTKKLLTSLNDYPRVSVRVNTKWISRNQAADQLKDQGFDVQHSTVARDGLILAKGPAHKSKLFKDGLMTIQDESSQVVTQVLDPQPSDWVLDACAAPGGKTTHIANYLRSDMGGRINASDIHKNKVNLIDGNVERQNFSSVVETSQMDAKKAGKFYQPQSFDKILIDAPCSGLGLMRRKPDIRYTKNPADIRRLHQVQVDILNHVAPLLKEGGRLVYSTCTILKQENEDVVKEFLDQHPQFELEQIDLVDSEVKPLNKTLLLLPHVYGTDGFFIASLVKKSK